MIKGICVLCYISKLIFGRNYSDLTKDERTELKIGLKIYDPVFRGRYSDAGIRFMLARHAEFEHQKGLGNEQEDKQILEELRFRSNIRAFTKATVKLSPLG